MALVITSTPTEFSVRNDDHDEWGIEVSDDGSLTLSSYIGIERCAMYYGECRGASGDLDIHVPDDEKGDVLAALIVWLEQLG